MIQDYYKSGFEIHRLTTTNVGGIQQNSYSVSLQLSGRMRPLSGKEIIENEKLKYETSHRFYCDVWNLENTDRIVDTNNSKTYEIVLIKNPMEMNEHLEVDCKYIQE